MYKSLFVLLVFIHCQDVLADSLSDSRGWSKLLHINEQTKESEIENADFFLSSNGQNNPKLELEATITAFKNDHVDPKTGDLSLCKYPARALFLRQHGYEIKDPLLHCDALNKWLGPPDDISISVIYADGYLGNPASFYGHLLFKVNNAKGQNLLTNSLNFGAVVPDDENPLVYILKGLLGGYGAEYSSNHFYRYNINYAEVEMRDLWDYRLDLSKQEALLLAVHAWEMLFTHYTYYFTDRNCAYHVAKLLELVIDDELISSQDRFVLPISVFDSLINAKTISGKKAVQSIVRMPSRQSRFRQQFTELTKEQKGVLEGLIDKQDWTEVLEPLAPQAQVEVLDTLLIYLNFLLVGDAENKSLIAKKKQAQKARIRLPVREKAFVPSEKQLPHTSHYPSAVRVGLGYNREAGAFANVMFRPAFYDLLSDGGGILPNSALSMAQIDMRISNSDIQLASLKLINIETFQLNATGLPGDYGLSWKLVVGNDRDFTNIVPESNEFFVEGGIGKAKQYKSFVFLMQLDGRIQTPNKNNERFYVSPKLSVLLQTNKIRAHCEVSYPISIRINNAKKPVAMCQSRFFASKTSDVRIKVKKHFQTEAQIQFSYYF